MIKTLPYKTKQFLVVVIKLSIVVVAFYYIYHKLIYNSELELNVFVAFLSTNDIFSFKNSAILVMLTILNWFFEILKWKVLVSSVTYITLKKAMEQSLSALTASLLTPNRIGEYGAKAIYFPRPLRKKIMLINLIGNMMQMTTTVLFGIVGVAFLSKNHSMPFNFLKASLFGIIVLIILGIIYFSLKRNRFEIKGFSLKNISSFIYYIPSDVKLKSSLFSVFRYVIFSFQFYYMLTIFGVSLDYFNTMMMISSMYLLSSIIPSIIIFDVVIKGSVAVYLFSIIGVPDLTVLCIVTIMWLLNFVVPSVFGSFYVLNFNFLKQEDNI